jgi:hypothetical protein
MLNGVWCLSGRVGVNIEAGWWLLVERDTNKQVNFKLSLKCTELVKTKGGSNTSKRRLRAVRYLKEIRSNNSPLCTCFSFVLFAFNIIM